MKALMILGALIGFGIGLLLALSGHGTWPTAVFRAAAAAVAGGMLLRWWGRVWLQSLRAAREQQMTQSALARRNQTQKGDV